MVETEEVVVLNAKDYSIKDYLELYELIKIPIYQRSYAWDEKNVRIFISDINENESYYIGNIMSSKIDEASVDIIDGQQRMISLFLLLCSLKNDFGITITDDIDLKAGKLLEIEERTPVSDSNILEHIYNNSIPNNLEKKPEVIIYKKIKKEIEALIPEEEIENFFSKILRLTIVEIKFTDDGYDAHNIFVNLNTKGKQLEDIDVLKSQVLKYCSDNPTDSFFKTTVKENWYDMLQLFKPEEYQRYVDLYCDVNYTRPSNRTRLSMYLELLYDEPTTKDFYEKFINNDTEICPFSLSCSAVFKHDLSGIEEKIGDDGYSFEPLNTIIKGYQKIKFKQFDIVLASLFYFKGSRDKRYFVDNYEYIYDFLVFIYMNQLIMSSKNISPSQYGNNLIKLAKKLYSHRDKKEVIKEIISEIPTFATSRADLIDFIKSIECNSKNAKMTTARLIIQSAFNNYVKDYKLEHFLNESSTELKRYSIGNCIPVKRDKYKTLSVVDKLARYETKRATEEFIDNFLNTGIDETNYNNKIDERAELIATNFADRYITLYTELTR